MPSTVENLNHIVEMAISGHWPIKGATRYVTKRGPAKGRVRFKVKSKGRTGASARQALIARGLTF